MRDLGTLMKRSEPGRVPVWISGAQRRQSEAGVPVQFGLTPGPLDGAFEAFAEEALKQKQNHTVPTAFFKLLYKNNEYRYHSATSKMTPQRNMECVKDISADYENVSLKT